MAGPGARRGWLVGAGCMAGLPVMAGLAGWGPALAASPGGRVRQVRFALEIRNPFGHVLHQQRLWCYLPANAVGGQWLREVQVSMAHRVVSDALGHQILCLEMDGVPPHARRRVSITSRVEVDGSHEALASAPASASASAPQAAAAWLGPERFIESDAPEVLQLARQLRRASALDSARAIHDWVLGHLHYAGYIAEDLGALHALRMRSGDCTEYANLVVALARAMDIPARMVGGYLAEHDMVLKPQDYHNWAEVQLDGQWLIVDTQKGHWLPPRAGYITFRIYRDVATNPVGLAHRFHVDGDLQAQLGT